jgi:hypothetical protein
MNPRLRKLAILPLLGLALLLCNQSPAPAEGCPKTCDIYISYDLQCTCVVTTSCGDAAWIWESGTVPCNSVPGGWCAQGSAGCP